jgi:hypothetical protein
MKLSPHIASYQNAIGMLEAKLVHVTRDSGRAVCT